MLVDGFATNRQLLPLILGADVAQLVEHVLGKDGVSGSIPLIGSRVFEARRRLLRRYAVVGLLPGEGES